MSIPWVEKYRPSNFQNIVLTPNTRNTMNQWIHQKRFPNILLHGPPGTGKTTTAWNIIRKYQCEVEGINEMEQLYTDSYNVISLNASDDNGIETLRQRIHVFVQGKPLFSKNTLKFVILDEIDHMTPHAQRMLCFILQEYQDTIRYVLICNYISHLDKRLQNQIRVLNFYGMNSEEIKDFLLDICRTEGIPLDRDSPFFSKIISKYDCDIRSMINALQQYSQVYHNTPKHEKTLKEEWNIFVDSCDSLESFIEWIRRQDNPKELLHMVLQYGLSNTEIENPKWFYQGLCLHWDGQTNITSFTPIQQNSGFTELVAWFLNRPLLKEN